MLLPLRSSRAAGCLVPGATVDRRSTMGELFSFLVLKATSWCFPSRPLTRRPRPLGEDYC